MIVGLDVGLSGAICFLENDSVEIIDMPVIDSKDTTYSRWYDTEKIFEKIENLDRKETRIYLEYQRPMPNQGIVSMFRLGRGFGLLEGIFRSKFDFVELVDPKSWQNYLSKRFLSKEEIDEFKENRFTKILNRIEVDEERNILTKLLFGSNHKISKAKTFYTFLKSGWKSKIDNSMIKKHDRIDSFMIALFGHLKSEENLF